MANTKDSKLQTEPALERGSAADHLSAGLKELGMAGRDILETAKEGAAHAYETIVEKTRAAEQQSKRGVSNASRAIGGALGNAAQEVQEGTRTVGERLKSVTSKGEGLLAEQIDKALHAAGVPRQKDLDSILKRLDQLERRVAALSAGGSRAGRSRKASPAGGTKKAALTASPSARSARKKTAPAKSAGSKKEG